MRNKIKQTLKKFILFLTVLFLFSTPSYSLDLKNSPEDCTFIINNINDEQKKELAYYWRGMYYYEKEDYSKAISDFTESIKRAKTKDALEESYFYRGSAYFNITNFDKAIFDFTQAINNCVDDLSKQVECYLYRGRTYLMIGNYSMAKKDSSEVIQKGYADKVEWAFPAYYTRGMANKELKNYKDAISDLTKFIRYEQNNLQDPDMILQVGDAYFARAHTRIIAELIESNKDIVLIFKDLEDSVKTYSLWDNPIANEKKQIVLQYIDELNSILNKYYAN